MEARPITAGTVTRRCIVVKIGELAYDRFKEILEQGAGSILILLPRNISRYSIEQIQVETSSYYNKIIHKTFFIIYTISCIVTDEHISFCTEFVTLEKYMQISCKFLNLAAITRT